MNNHLRTSKCHRLHRPILITHPSIKGWDYINMKSCQSITVQILTEYCFPFQAITIYCNSLHFSTVKIICHAAHLFQRYGSQMTICPPCATDLNRLGKLSADFSILFWPGRIVYEFSCSSCLRLRSESQLIYRPLLLLGLGNQIKMPSGRLEITPTITDSRTLIRCLKAK